MARGYGEGYAAPVRTEMKIKPLIIKKVYRGGSRCLDQFPQKLLCSVWFIGE
jgi:hypothetical protein